jgi:23S rRNA maturation mini-RNase III
MENTINLFLYEHGTFSKSLQFETIIFFVVILIVFTYFFRKTFAFVVILLIFAMYLSELYVKSKTSRVTDFNKITLSKLTDIQNKINETIINKLDTIENTGSGGHSNSKLAILRQNQMKYLYLDATMIHFIHSVLPLAKNNERLFLSWVKGVNNILLIKSQIEDYYTANQEYPHNISEMFQQCLQLQTNTINNVHDFVYSVPNLKYVDQVIDRYSVLIQRNCDLIHQYYLHSHSINGINNKSKFVSYNTTKPYDAHTNHSIVNNKNKEKYLSFYY